jgi:hypothetical protein
VRAEESYAVEPKANPEYASPRAWALATQTKLSDAVLYDVSRDESRSRPASVELESMSEVGKRYVS